MGRGSKQKKPSGKKSAKVQAKDDFFREEDIDDEIDACKHINRRQFFFFFFPSRILIFFQLLMMFCDCDMQFISSGMWFLLISMQIQVNFANKV